MGGQASSPASAGQEGLSWDGGRASKFGKTDQAEKILKELVAMPLNDEIHFESHLRLGLLYMDQKRFKDAIAAFSAALQGPEERVAGQAQLKLGEAHLGANEKELAILQFSKVVYLYSHQSEVMEEALLNWAPFMEEEGF
jgi:tetratricopeptide (TPR) repeat protein